MLKLTMISDVDKNKSNLLLLTRFVLHCALLENFSRRVREMILVASGYEVYCRLFHNVDLINLKFQRILRPPSRFAHVYINNKNNRGDTNKILGLNQCRCFSEPSAAILQKQKSPSFRQSLPPWYFQGSFVSFCFFFVSLSLEFVCLCLRPCCYPWTLERD